MTEIASVLVGRRDIERRVEALGRTITSDYAGREPIFVAMIKGGSMFLADLVRQIDLPLQTHFLAITRYGDAAESQGRVRILLDIEADVAGRDVVLVEDIVDTGLTLRYLRSVMQARGPASVEVATFLDRSARRIAPVTPRYIGFDCPDRFVVGYGLDFQERYRNLPDLFQVDDLAALRADPDALVSRFAPSIG